MRIKKGITGYENKRKDIDKSEIACGVGGALGRRPAPGTAGAVTSTRRDVTTNQFCDVIDQL